jgi:hypothetical protein
LLRSSVPEQRLRIVADYEQRDLHEQLHRHRASSAAASSLPTTTAEQTSLLLLIAYDYRWARICARYYYRVRRRHSCYCRLAEHYLCSVFVDRFADVYPWTTCCRRCHCEHLPTLASQCTSCTRVPE